MNKALLSGTGLIIAVILFFAINILSNILFKSSRFDFTEKKRFTLSEGTKNIIDSIDEPIMLRFFFSKKIAASSPKINTYALRVQELLAEFARRSDGNIKLEIIEPDPFSDAEDKAVEYGLQGFAVDTSNTMFYFGMVGVNSVDEEGIIPFFQQERESFLEYDISRLIYTLATTKKPVIGLMSQLPLEAGKQSLIIMEQIKQQYDVQTLAIELDRIPEDVSILMLVHPKKLSEKTLFAIDQFVLNGGNALIFVDPYAEAEQPDGDASNPIAALTMNRSSELTRLFSAWGITVGDKVITDTTLTHQVRFARSARQTELVNYIVWLGLGQAQINRKNIITSELESINIATAGSISKNEGADITFEALLNTSKDTYAMETSGLAFNLQDPNQLLQKFKSENKIHILAARITGSVKTAFAEGSPEKEAEATGLKESIKPMNIVIIADTDLLQDQFWVQVQNFLGQKIAIPTANNGTFIINALDNLSGSSDLISVRSRGTFTRPFIKVDEIKKVAEANFQTKERELKKELEATESRLQQLQKQKADNSLILSRAQQEEVEQFRDQKLRIRKDLRDVRHQLSKDIEKLEVKLKVINIIVIPVLVAFIGLFGMVLVRARRAQEGV